VLELELDEDFSLLLDFVSDLDSDFDSLLVLAELDDEPLSLLDSPLFPLRA
jgi:hypothetical protein